MDGKICTKDGCTIMPLTKREARDLKFMCIAYRAIKETYKLNCDVDIWENPEVAMLEEMVGEKCERFYER